MTIAIIVAAAALVGGCAALANGSGACGWHHGVMSGHSAADVSAHVDQMLKHLYVEIDATDAQKAQITPLVKQAVGDLLPLHTQLQAAHTQAVQGLTMSPVDRTALEAARVTHLQPADHPSTPLLQPLPHSTHLLTPPQPVA